MDACPARPPARTALLLALLALLAASLLGPTRRPLAAQEGPDADAAAAAAVAYARALALLEGVPVRGSGELAAACQTNNPRQQVCVRPAAVVPASPARGTAAFEYASPDGEERGVILFGRTPGGTWHFWDIPPLDARRRLDLPGPLLVCTDGAGLALRLAPSADAAVLATLLDRSTVWAEAFTLTDLGVVLPRDGRLLVNPIRPSSGWYLVLSPLPGWVPEAAVSRPAVDVRTGQPSCTTMTDRRPVRR